MVRTLLPDDTGHTLYLPVIKIKITHLVPAIVPHGSAPADLSEVSCVVVALTFLSTEEAAEFRRPQKRSVESKRENTYVCYDI